MKIEVGIRDALDRWTILAVKSAKVTDVIKLDRVNNDLQSLGEQILLQTSVTAWDLKGNKTITKLLLTNTELWSVEDELRALDRHLFEETEADLKVLNRSRYIAFARSVYQLNDKRGELKRQLDEQFDSSIREVKQYAEYDNARD